MNAIVMLPCIKCESIHLEIRLKVQRGIVRCQSCGFEAEAIGGEEEAIDLWNSAHFYPPSDGLQT